jgi:hypothetical protein
MPRKNDKELIRIAQQWLRNAYGGYRMRAFERNVPYLNHELITSDAAYLGSPRFVVTVAASHHTDLGESWPEMPWILPAEVRLLASLALSTPEGAGMLSFVPSEFERVLDLPDNVHLSDPQLLDSLRSAAEQLCLSIVPPNEFYEMRSDSIDRSEQVALLESIQYSNNVLMRGVYCMLKSTHLFATRMFGEEAFMNIQIAREAALELIRDRIGGQSVGYAEAHSYIRSNFKHGDSLAEFLKDQHDRWVATRHPRSRHGEFWTPPLMLDDYHETHGVVVSLFRHLLLKEPGRNIADL